MTAATKEMTGKQVTAMQSTAARLQRYDRPGPRYTSYPTAVEFSDRFDEAAYRGRLEAAAIAIDEPLSLYVHLPFCEERCLYCGCMTIITQRHDVAAHYLEYLEREIEMVATALQGRRRVIQLHWGGGTPTYFTVAEIERLHTAITRHFDVQVDAEIAIEIDPRATSRQQLRALRSLGFNRLSMGVQDFTPDVQSAIGRYQPEHATRELYEYARAIGFNRINIDLIYGLPRQNVESFSRTLAAVTAMRPDRIAVYSYAHVPWLRPHQKHIDASELPSREVKWQLIGTAIESFAGAGYMPIGMDHFALADDELAVSTRERRLHRNFMGYTTRRATDMVGVGLSAIGEVSGAFAQNVKKLSSYFRAIDAGQFPTERGYALTKDDGIRRHVISELMCNFFVDAAAIEARFGVDVTRYFATEFESLRAPGGPVSDGLLDISPRGIEVSPEGRLFVRTICMHFDRYLQCHQDRPT
ncbi:MAG: oxygen-independent coproporphyrinogen III oxidase, partial [Acidobacteria bacterium]|nr:oxygen-independent coproporphyrinogen III oxidase [Acidobacteriota bacterium]